MFVEDAVGVHRGWSLWERLLTSFWIWEEDQAITLNGLPRAMPPTPKSLQSPKAIPAGREKVFKH